VGHRKNNIAPFLVGCSLFRKSFALLKTTLRTSKGAISVRENKDDKRAEKN